MPGLWTFAHGEALGVRRLVAALVARGARPAKRGIDPKGSNEIEWVEPRGEFEARYLAGADLSHVSSGPLVIYQTPDLTLVDISQLEGQRFLRKVLVTHRSREPLYGPASDRGGPHACRRGIGSAMMH